VKPKRDAVQSLKRGENYLGGGWRVGSRRTWFGADFRGREGGEERRQIDDTASILEEQDGGSYFVDGKKKDPCKGKGNVSSRGRKDSILVERLVVSGEGENTGMSCLSGGGKKIKGKKGGKKVKQKRK